MILINLQHLTSMLIHHYEFIHYVQYVLYGILIKIILHSGFKSTTASLIKLDFLSFL
jgi:hypothetical protein